MNTFFVLFVSACMYGSCAWFEITDPVFTTGEECVAHAQQYADEMQKMNAEAYGNMACIPSEDAQEFREFIKTRTGEEPESYELI
jgi:hypothetical protein